MSEEPQGSSVGTQGQSHAYACRVTLRAAFFDVGDTLVEGWAPRELLNSKMRARICEVIGERDWLDDWFAGDLEPVWDSSYALELAARTAADSRFEPEVARQETLRWYSSWFEQRGINLHGVDLEQLRGLMCVPLDEVTSLVPGALEALRWCVDSSLRVVLVTNTLSRGDLEALEDWRRFGVGELIHGVVSSHTFGWRKPHPAIFERALEIAGARPEEAFHVGDNLIADVWAAQQLGIRAIWRRPARRDVAKELSAAEVAACRHPSEGLALDDALRVRCGRCGGDTGLAIRPDAFVDDLTELPPLVEKWLGA